MREVDQLIHAAWIAPVEPAGVVLEGHCVAVLDGRIDSVLPSDQAATTLSARAEVRLDRHLLVPGFVNLHGHAAMSLLRGIADDLPLMAWLKDHVWPAEARHVGDEFVHDGSLLAAVEMLRGGTTCFNDMYFFPEATARAALREAPISQVPPCGRETPRWSVAGQPMLSPALMAALPASSAWV